MNATKRNCADEAPYILEYVEMSQTLRGFVAERLEVIASERQSGLRRSIRPATEDGLLRQIRRCIAKQTPLPQ